MEPRALAGVKAKLRWAWTRFGVLEQSVKDYLGSEPARVEVTHVHDPEGAWVEWVMRGSFEPPLELSILAGEIVHQLRSSLDHLAFALPRQPSALGEHEIAFPFIEKSSVFDRPHRLVSGLDATIVATIRKLQPFAMEGPFPSPVALHPARLLREISNTEKHRLLPLTTAAVENVSYWGPSPQYLNFAELPGDGVVLARFRPGDTDVDPRPSIGWRVMFVEPQTVAFQTLVDTIESMLRFVEGRAVPELAPHL